MPYQDAFVLEPLVYKASTAFASFKTDQFAMLLVDVSVTSLRGTSPTIQPIVERKGSDDVWYPVYKPTALSAAGTFSTSIGVGMETPAPLGTMARLRFVLGGTSYSTTVTTGANSATQLVGSTANMAVGDTLHFGTANVDRTISSITDGTHVVLNASVNSTTSETVTVSSTPAATLSASIRGK